MTAQINRLESAIAYVSPYMAHQKVRYATYALGILSMGALSYKCSTLPLPMTIIPASLFVLYQKNRDIMTGIGSWSEQEQTQKAERIAYDSFVTAGIWGIVLGGTTLTLGFEGGRLLLRGALSLNPLKILKAVNSLSCIGWIWAPLSFYLLNKSDDILFRNGENRLQARLENFFKNIQHDLQAFSQRTPPVALLTSFFNSGYKSYLPKQLTSSLNNFEKKLLSFISSFFQAEDGKPASVGDLQLAALQIFEDYRLLKFAAEVAPEVTAPAPVSAQEKAKKIACGAFHYSFTAVTALLPLYLNPLPTIAGLGLGWFYPSGLQSEKTLKKWTIVPNFIDQTLSQNCWYIWETTFQTLNKVGSLISYPFALGHGYLWAQRLHYYIPNASVSPPK